jgi:biotin operon repressor
MSVRAVAWAFNQDDLSPIDKLVLVAIADMANDETGICWPSQAFLADRCGICRQRVNQALATLRDKGLVLVSKRRKSSCVYRLTMSPLTTPRVPNVAHDDIMPTMMSPTTTGNVAHDDTEPLIEPKKVSKEDSVAYATGAEAPPDPVKDMWDRGKAVLGKSAGGIIGKMLSEHGPEAVVAAILACERECPIEPVEFFMGCLRRHSKKRSAVEKFYAGAMEAADEFTRWQQQQSGDSGASHAPPLSLLDGR